MAIVEMQGLDNYGVGNTEFEGYTPMTTGTPVFVAGGGKRGGVSLQFDNGELLRHTNNFFTVNDTYSVACHFKLTTISSSQKLIVIQRSTTSDSTVYSELAITVTVDGAVEVRDDNGVTYNLFPVGSVIAGEWYYLCVSSTKTNSATAYVRLNNAITSQVMDTYGSSTSSYPCFMGGGTNLNYDDIVITDDNTYYQNAPRVIEHIVPSADRAAQDFAPLGAGAGYVEVDDLIPDGDTSYISATTVGSISEFELSNLPADVTEVHAAKVVSYGAREGVGGTNGVDTSFHLSAGTQLGIVNQPLTDGSYTVGESTIVDLTAYTIADVNGFYVKNEVV